MGKLFGSPARVKILRLFLFNPEEVYESSEVAKRARITSKTVRRELSTLSHIGFVKKKTCYKEVEKKKGKNVVVTKKKISGWILNAQFPYLEALQSFLLKATPLDSTEVARRLNKAGALRLVIVAGLFIQNWDSRLDILIVGSKINKLQLVSIIKDMEAELVKESIL